MASEQKLQRTDDNRSNPTSATNGDSLNPSSDSQRPSCCASNSGHKGEPGTHPLPPEDRREQEEGSKAREGHGEQQEGRAGAGKEEEEISENEEVPVGLLVSLGDNGPSEEERADQGSQVTGEETRRQVLSCEIEVQGTDNGTGVKTEPQMTGEEAGFKGIDDEKETRTKIEETYSQTTGEETGEQVTGEDRVPQTDEDRSPQATICEVGDNVGPDNKMGGQVDENPMAQVSNAAEKWINMLIHSIVTEATGEEAWTGEQDKGAQVSLEATEMMEEEHSTMQVTGMETMTGGQVMVRGAGAADRQVSNDSTDIALHMSGEEPEIQVRAEQGTAIPEQVHEERTDIEKQVHKAHREVSEGAQVTVTGEEVHEDISRNLEAGGQFIASGGEADREVTPDLDALPGREGTGDQDQPVACREKEWPSLICTVSEVGTVTAEQGDTQPGSLTQEGPSDRTPAMKEREMVEDGYTPNQETPIEREIRLAMEREMTLRQERGISFPIGQPELVEVRRKTILLEPVAVPGKERQLAGAQMQREIQLETQREQDLVELGKVMGTYDRGPQQELQERKMIFESMKTESFDAPIMKKKSEPWQQPKPQEAPSSYVSVSSNHVVPVIETKKGPSYAEANGSNVIIIEHSSMLRRSAPGYAFGSSPADSSRSTPADSRRFITVDSSSSNRQVISADSSSFNRQVIPADSRRSTPADFSSSNCRVIPAEISSTNSSGSALPNSADSPVPPGSPFQLQRSPSPRSLLEREIEEVKERELELRRQRSSVYGSEDSAGETIEPQEMTTDVQSVYQPERPSWGKLEVNWPPNKDEAMNGQQQVLDSPRTRRQRSALIQSWESGNPNPKDDE